MKWNILDFFLILLVILAGLSAYFTLVKPISFSHLIKREGVYRFADVDILLPDYLSWMRDVIPVGEESRNVYGDRDWKILGFQEVQLAGRKMTKVKAKLWIVKDSSGLLRYGKYTLVKGNKIYLINDRYVLEGWVLDYQVAEERIQF